MDIPIDSVTDIAQGRGRPARLAYSGVRTSLLFTNIYFVSLGLLAALRRV